MNLEEKIAENDKILQGILDMQDDDLIVCKNCYRMYDRYCTCNEFEFITCQSCKGQYCINCTEQLCYGLPEYPCEEHICIKCYNGKLKLCNVCQRFKTNLLKKLEEELLYIKNLELLNNG